MFYQPWLHHANWHENDSKLCELHKSATRLPHLDAVLQEIPVKPGIFSLLGPRQVGKSTLLKLFAKKCLKTIDSNCLLYVNGDEIETWQELKSGLADFCNQWKDNQIGILIDEVTSIPDWHRAIKTLADHGYLQTTVLLYTGSSMISLKHSGELFPGRRGRHSQVDFTLNPASYRQLQHVISLEDYFMIGGFPWAINEYLRLGIVPNYVGDMYWSWLQGEFLKKGKSNRLLKHMVHAIAQRTHTGFSQNSLAREMGIVSNDTARQYMELLMDSFAVNHIMWADFQTGTISPRKNGKYYPIDPLLFHLFHANGIWPDASILHNMSSDTYGKLAEVIVCQELHRRYPDYLISYWQGKKEIDFIVHMNANMHYIEVKYQSRVTANEFAWFKKHASSHASLTVITKNSHFYDDCIRGIPLQDWLCGDG